MKNHFYNALTAACRSILKPLAKFLLRYGYSYTDFAEVAKWAFVTVASEEYGLSGRRTNVSRVAVMTGLSRKEVRRIRDLEIVVDEPAFFAATAAGSVLSTWHQDLGFLDDSGAPRPLSAVGDDSGFSNLVRAACGDVPVGAVLAELRRVGAVKETKSGGVVPSTRYFVPLQADPSLIRRLGARLGDLCTTIDYNIHSENDPNRLFEATAYSTHFDQAALARFKKVAGEKGLSFLESIDDWLDAHCDEGGDRNDRQALRAGIGIYVFVDEPSDDNE